MFRNLSGIPVDELLYVFDQSRKHVRLAHEAKTSRLRFPDPHGSPPLKHDTFLQRIENRLVLVIDSRYVTESFHLQFAEL